MKTVEEIKKIIIKLTKQAKELEEQAEKMLDNWRDTRSDAPDMDTWHETREAAETAYKKADELKKIVTVWKYNLMHAKKAELLPIWIKIMNEYQGKKIGAVREEEIRNKLHALGVSGYFSKYEYHSPKICLSFLNGGYCYGSDYIELTGNYNISFFDNDNKFLMPELESFKFQGENIGYIENPKQYIKQLEKTAARARKAAAAYDEIIHEYNAAAIPGFSQIDTYKEAPWSIAKYFKITK